MRDESYIGSDDPPDRSDLILNNGSENFQEEDSDRLTLGGCLKYALVGTVISTLALGYVLYSVNNAISGFFGEPAKRKIQVHERGNDLGTLISK